MFENMTWAMGHMCRHCSLTGGEGLSPSFSFVNKWNHTVVIPAKDFAKAEKSLRAVAFCVFISAAYHTR